MPTTCLLPPYDGQFPQPAKPAGTVRNALKVALPGVKVTIDMEQQRIIVDGDPACAAAIIRDAGYDPVIVTA